MKTGEPVESLSLSKFLVLYMRKYQFTFNILLLIVVTLQLSICTELKCSFSDSDATVMSELAFYRVGKLVATFCFITCKVLAAE